MLGDSRGDEAGHGVVDAPPGQDYLRRVARLGRPVGEVERIDADAMAAHQARRKIEEVPFGPCRVEHLEDRKSKPVADHRHLVDEGDVDVALGVLDGLGRLGGLDVAGDEHVAAGDRAVDLGEAVGHRPRLPRHHLGDAVHGVLGIAGVHAFGGVTEEKVAAAFEAREAGDEGTTDLLGDAGVDGAFEDHDGTRRDLPADRPAGGAHGTQVGPVVGVHRRRHGDDEYVRARQIGGLAGKGDTARRHRPRRHRARAIVTFAEGVEVGAVDVESADVKMPRQRDGQRQADVTKADHRDTKRRDGPPRRLLGRREPRQEAIADAADAPGPRGLDDARP